eukprot:g61630.t1
MPLFSDNSKKNMDWERGLVGDTTLRKILYAAVVVEGSLCLLLIFPVLNSTKTNLVKWLDKQPWTANFVFVLYGLLLVIGMCFAGSFMTLRQLDRQDGVFNSMHVQRRLDAELDRMLSGSCLFLLIFAKAYFGLLKAHNLLEIKHWAMEKQASNLNAHCASLMKEIEELKGKSKKGSSNAEVEAELCALREKLATEKGRVAKAEQELKANNVEMIALRKQAKSAGESYLQLAEKLGKASPPSQGDMGGEDEEDEDDEDDGADSPSTMRLRK